MRIFFSQGDSKATAQRQQGQFICTSEARVRPILLVHDLARPLEVLELIFGYGLQSVCRSRPWPLKAASAIRLRRNESFLGNAEGLQTTQTGCLGGPLAPRWFHDGLSRERR